MANQRRVIGPKEKAKVAIAAIKEQAVIKVAGIKVAGTVYVKSIDSVPVTFSAHANFPPALVKVVGSPHHLR